MEKIKNYFRQWDSARYFRLALGVILGIAYVFGGESMYLLGSVFFFVQAVLNMGCGCAPGGNCATDIKKTDKQTEYEFEKYKHNS